MARQVRVMIQLDSEGDHPGVRSDTVERTYHLPRDLSWASAIGTVVGDAMSDALKLVAPDAGSSNEPVEGERIRGGE